MRKLIENLKRYKRTSVVQKTALAYLVHHFHQNKDVINSCTKLDIFLSSENFAL